MLGFFTADGSMTKNERGAHFIEIEITDKGLLYKIRRIICSNHKISVRERKFPCKTAYRLQIGSKEMFYDLMGLGLTPAKSKIVNLPKIPNQYLSHFTRGYFDGDGSVTICKYIRADRNNRKSFVIISGFVSGSKKILGNLHTRLKESANISGGALNYNSRGYRLNFSVKDSLKLYRFMYRNLEGGLFLNRKKKIFEKYFKIS